MELDDAVHLAIQAIEFRILDFLFSGEYQQDAVAPYVAQLQEAEDILLSHIDKFESAISFIRVMVINDGTHADISILAERKLQELELEATNE